MSETNSNVVSNNLVLNVVMEVSKRLVSGCIKDNKDFKDIGGYGLTATMLNEYSANDIRNRIRGKV